MNKLWRDLNDKTGKEHFSTKQFGTIALCDIHFYKLDGQMRSQTDHVFTDRRLHSIVYFMKHISGERAVIPTIVWLLQKLGCDWQ
jgi:hypothetical protein